MKRTLLSLAAVASLGAASAQATTFNYGDIVGTSIFNTVSHVAGAFEDFIFFSTSTDSYGSLTVADIPFTFSSLSITNIDNLKAYIYDDLGVVGTFEPGTDVNFLGTHLGMGDYFTGAGVLTAGNYVIKIKGDANGLNGGNYYYNASAMPVPEAETYAMLLAGLGLVGMSISRRTSI